MSFTAVAVLVWVLVAGLGLRGWARTARLAPRRSGAAALHALAIVCPARDEIEVIDATLDGLLAQGAGRVVAIDDGSRDGTRARLEARAEGGARLAALDAPPTPAGHKGKPAALAHAVRAATGDAQWLLFVDADVTLRPGAAAALLAHAEAQGLDLLSAFPRVRMESLLEQVIMPAVGGLVLLRHPPHRVDAGRPFANGQLLLVRRSAYDAAGGHAAVAGSILEDVRLAEAVAAQAGRLAAVDGQRLGETRMYASLAELREGWEKNLFLLLGGRLGPMLGGLALTASLAWLGPLAALVDGWGGLVGWGLIALLQAGLRSLGGASPWLAPLAPLGALAAAGLALSSAWRHLRGAPLAWKGRVYSGEAPESLD